MFYMWFTGINYYKLAVEKDHDSIFTTIGNQAFTFALLWLQSKYKECPISASVACCDLL